MEQWRTFPGLMTLLTHGGLIESVIEEPEKTPKVLLTSLLSAKVKVEDSKESKTG